MKEPTDHEELETRLSRAEELVDVLRGGQVDAILGKDRVFLLRAREAERASRRRMAVIEGINRVFREALTCETEEELARICLAVAEELTQSGFGFIGEVNHFTGKMDDIAVSDPGREACRMQVPSGHRARTPAGFTVHGLYGRVLRDGKGFFTNEPSSHPDGVGLPPGHPPLKAFLGVPLIHAGRPMGMVGLGNREGGYGQEDLEAVESVAPAMVQALLNIRAERKAIEEKERMQLATDAAGVFAWDVDLATGTITYSDSASQVFEAEALSDDHDHLDSYLMRIHEEDRARVSGNIERAIETTGSYADEYRFRVNKDHAWIETRGKVIYGGDGTPLRMLGVGQNITARKRMEEEFRRYRELLEQRVKERTAELMESEMVALAEAERRRNLAKRLVGILEEDRRQTAMMLHDDVGQTIAGARMQIESLRGELADLDPGRAEQFEGIQNALQGAVASLRDMSRQLHPGTLKSLGLVNALQAFSGRVQPHGCRIHLDCREMPGSLGYELELTAFRIAQEAVTNAVKHAGCREIHLRLSCPDNVLHLTVEDDGCGFVWENAVSDASGEGPLGLVIMRERAVYVGGELRVTSAPGVGTTVAAELPLGARSGTEEPGTDGIL